VLNHLIPPWIAIVLLNSLISEDSRMMKRMKCDKNRIDESRKTSRIFNAFDEKKNNKKP